MKVYIVTEIDEMEEHIQGVFYKYEDAAACANDLAEYGEMKQDDEWNWSHEGGFPCVIIEDWEVE